MNRRSLLKGLLAAPLALLGWKPAKATIAPASNVMKPDAICIEMGVEHWNDVATFVPPNQTYYWV